MSHVITLCGRHRAWSTVRPAHAATTVMPPAVVGPYCSLAPTSVIAVMAAAAGIPVDRFSPTPWRNSAARGEGEELVGYLVEHCTRSENVMRHAWSPAMSSSGKTVARYTMPITARSSNGAFCTAGWWPGHAEITPPPRGPDRQDPRSRRHCGCRGPGYWHAR